ncbi:undecaprenyl-diphosphatase UppP [Patescibacteria group bacterium]|nr:undecaprenyl-diphosphatase UppP [Patescibacteria group bacterium]MBU1034454.1 undecaprenyl-diphosphatase UppP [Patescibacteria group bacterium]MBU1630008.1 undecaprenyl-diphosphatase UppP [Patescibacteria group bacterium]MBU1907699.1 undecaprenyl-diphosphatase UppP [Patescibacteria group bacterium]
MTILDSLLLGIVQGATEFLPISSSGHLVLMREFLGINTQGGLAFDAILQLGTALAVIIYFRRTVVDLIKKTCLMLIGKGKQVEGRDRSLIIGLVAGTLPAIATGVLLEDIMATIFRNVTLVALMLVSGGLLMLAAEKKATQKLQQPSVKQGWWIGWFQTLALVPGVSRSGATISGGLVMGLTREAAARFSFLLSIPIIAGSGMKKLFDVMHGGSADAGMLQISLGFIAAFAVGLFCIDFLMKYLKRHTLHAFVWYRFGLAMLTFLLFFLKP